MAVCVGVAVLKAYPSPGYFISSFVLSTLKYGFLMCRREMYLLRTSLRHSRYNLRCPVIDDDILSLFVGVFFYLTPEN